MKPESIPVPPGFAELSKAQQIDYLQWLWDEISVEVDDLPLNESHLAEVERRIAEYRLHPEDALPAYEALEHMRQTLG